VGIVHDAGHDEPWIIAMDSAPTRAKVLDYAARWCQERIKMSGFHRFEMSGK
jgi:hypothetical protein